MFYTFIIGFITALFVDKEFLHKKIKQTLPLYIYLMIVMTFAYLQSLIKSKYLQMKNLLCKRQVQEQEEPKKITFPIRKIEFNTNLNVGEGYTS